MNLSFERGTPERPAGHAIVYFTTGTPRRILATYIVIPPIALNISKYMPPMFAANLPITDSDDMRPVPLPPVPEEVAGLSYLQQLAEARNDDLVDAGSILDTEPQRLLLEAGYAAEAYGEMYRQYIDGAVRIEEPTPASDLDTATAIYSAMSEGERLNELTKLTGALRETIEQGDLRGTAENVRTMRALIETLPAKYRGSQLLASAQEPGERGRRLCELLLERAYALYREEYLDVGRLDREIDELHTPPSP